MSRGRGGLSAGLVLSICVANAIVVPGAAAKELAPFRVALEVRWGAGAGSDAFRDDLSRSLAGTLAANCFAGISTGPPEPTEKGADLAFDVVLSDVVDETRFDDSIAGTLQPGEPTKELRRVTYFEVTVDASLTAREAGVVVHTKHLVARASRRPVYVGEDPQAMTRAESIDNIVRDLTRALGCGRGKLTERIREAMGAAGKAASGSR